MAPPWPAGVGELGADEGVEGGCGQPAPEGEQRAGEGSDLVAGPGVAAVAARVMAAVTSSALTARRPAMLRGGPVGARVPIR